jgi:hypothetical protein
MKTQKEATLDDLIKDLEFYQQERQICTPNIPHPIGAILEGLNQMEMRGKQTHRLLPLSEFLSYYKTHRFIK